MNRKIELHIKVVVHLLVKNSNRIVLNNLLIKLKSISDFNLEDAEISKAAAMFWKSKLSFGNSLYTPKKFICNSWIKKELQNGKITKLQSWKKNYVSSIKYARQIFQKTRMCAYHGVRNVTFWENVVYVLNGWHPVKKHSVFWVILSMITNFLNFILVVSICLK